MVTKMVWTSQLLFRLCQILAVFSVYEPNGRPVSGGKGY